MTSITGAAFGGKHSPQALLSQALGDAQSFRRVVIVAVDHDGCTFCGWSEGSEIEAMGMFAHGAAAMHDELSEEPCHD
jgi:hypothetical protein